MSSPIDTFASEVISLEASDHVATLWLDRPEKRNALGPAFWTDLPLAVAAITADRGIRAVVVAARGPHFSVGLDLVAMSGLVGPPEGGDIAAACDIRLASADALLSVRETKVAIVADLGSLQRLPRIIGKGHVAELAYTGKDITAARAREIGLVNDVSADADSVLADARALAAEIAANSPLAVQGTKAVLSACEDRSVADGLDYVATWNAGFLASDDLVEAMGAFLEKRPPTFTGR